MQNQKRRILNPCSQKSLLVKGFTSVVNFVGRSKRPIRGEESRSYCWLSSSTPSIGSLGGMRQKPTSEKLADTNT